MRGANEGSTDCQRLRSPANALGCLDGTGHHLRTRVPSHFGEYGGRHQVYCSFPASNTEAKQQGHIAVQSWQSLARHRRQKSHLVARGP